jgi:hypothetical protein
VDNDPGHQIRTQATLDSTPEAHDRSPEGGELPDIKSWTPSLFVLLVSGVVAGAVLGAADGALVHYIIGDFASQHAACIWGAALGIGGGVLFVLGRRAWWGPDTSVEIGTVLGLLYGIAPGAAVLYQSIFVNRVVGTWRLAGLVVSGAMAGLLIGGILDRCLEGIFKPRKEQ